MTDRKQLNKHDFSGSCAPGQRYTPHTNTFSVGIFQWVQARKGLKKSAVKIRVRGYVREPDLVYRVAEKLCAMLDNGDDPGIKSVMASDAYWRKFLGA